MIIEELWGDDVPKTASATMHTYVYRLRRLLQRLDPAAAAEAEPLTTSAPGYILRVREEQIDACVFERLADEGRHLFEAGDVGAAASILHDAVRLWRGQGLTNVAQGHIVEAQVAKLHEMYISASSWRPR